MEQGRIISIQTRTELNQQADNLEQEIRQLELRSVSWGSGQSARAKIGKLELSSVSESSSQSTKAQVRHIKIRSVS